VAPTETGQETLKYAVALWSVLFGVWLLWSGHYVPFLISVGAVCSAGVVLLVRRMGLLDSETVPIEITARAVLYAPWLLLQIVKSNLDVARRILTPSLPIRPNVIRVRAGQRTDLGRVVYANSITLTPGTVSIAVGGDVITVHALTEEAAREVEEGEMDRRVRRVEDGRP
jgi:multicomponent Na+:H+ antiporter subunit E